ncbi:hypothetical protein EDD86DRAFT_269177 [Gorgonomyces haynaldii]|nr:hypothetical protein EDD86DRAFT_269177 [Gorgonomyces haynaldii]
MLFQLIAPAAAQNCVADRLVDDFAKITTGTLPGDTTIKNLNLLGGDYGAAGANFSIDTANKHMNILAGTADIGTPEPDSNPGTSPTFNYWFAKFDIGACYDLTGYTGIAFDLVGPAGSDMNFTLTQKNPFCDTNPSNTTRLVDSVYYPLSKYATMDGTKKTVLLPFKDFSTNLLGGAFDFKHLKDWTAVNLIPSGAQFVMSNLILKGNCTTGSTGTITAGSPAPSTTGSTKNDATKSAVGFAAALAFLIL